MGWFTRGRMKLKQVHKHVPLPEQLSGAEGAANYRQAMPHTVFGGDRSYLNFFYGNQLPGDHILTLPHAWYTQFPNKDLSIQRSAANFGQQLSTLDMARLKAAAMAAWARAAGNQ